MASLALLNIPMVAAFPRPIGRSQVLSPCPRASCLGAAASTSAKKRSRPKGRLQFGRWLVGLEEDHAANLEDVEILELPADVFAEAAVGEAVRRGCVRRAFAADPEILSTEVVELEVLPASEQVHGGRVDFLHKANTPAIHLRSGDDRVSNHCDALVRSASNNAGRNEVLADAVVEAIGIARRVTAEPAGHLVLLAPLAPEHRCTHRQPSPLDTGFYEPSGGFISSAVFADKANALMERAVPDLSAVFLVVLVQAVGEQARRDVQNRRANLEELAVLAEDLERGGAAHDHRDVAASPATMEDAWGGAAFVGQLGIASCRRNLDAVPVGSVFDSDIPHVVFAI